MVCTLIVNKYRETLNNVKLHHSKFRMYCKLKNYSYICCVQLNIVLPIIYKQLKIKQL